jgi:hypothetical protein
MGQQQLLLVILVTVIVGIATVVAINTFGSASESAARDAIINDITAIAASAQAYYTKPIAMGGGGGSFEGIGFEKLAFAAERGTDGTSVTGTEAKNANGKYTIDGSGGTTLVITGESETYEFTCTATAIRDGWQNQEPPTCE